MILLENCYEGNLETVERIIAKEKPNDILSIKGAQYDIKIRSGTYDKSDYEVEQWNPILLAIARKHASIVKYLFENVPYFHHLNAISKPYSDEKQKELIVNQNKKLKRECFGLKLSIMNKDSNTFRYLWITNSMLWNIGHFLRCI